MESYEEYLDYREKGGKIPSKVFRNFLSQLSFLHWVLIVVFILIINSMIKKGDNPNWLFLVLGAIVIMWVLSLTETESVSEIPRHIAEKIALSDLNKLVQKDSAYPNGTKAIATGVFKSEHRDTSDGRGWRLTKYNFGFKISIPGKSDKHIIYQMNPFPPGQCQGIIYQEMPWQGEDVKDFQIILPEKTIMESDDN